MKIRRFNESISEDYVSILQEIFEDVAEDTKVTVRKVIYYPTVGATCFALVGDIWRKSSEGQNNLVHDIWPILDGDIYSVTVYDPGHSGIGDAIQRCEKYTDLSFVCNSMGDYVFVRNKEETTKRILTFIGKLKIAESKSNEDPTVLEIQDIFANIAEDTEVIVKKIRETHLMVGAVCRELMGREVYNKILYSDVHSEFLKKCRPHLQNMYQVFVSNVNHPGIEEAKKRCERYINLSFLSNTQKHIFIFIRDREGVTKMILSIMDMLLGINESKSIEDTHLSHLQDLFVEISDNTEVKIISDLQFSQRNCLEAMDKFGINFDTMNSLLFKNTNFKQLFTDHYYKAIVSFDRKDLDNKEKIKYQMIKVMKRCSSYGNFEVSDWWEGYNFWNIVFIRDKEGLIEKIREIQRNLPKIRKVGRIGKSEPE